MAKPPAILAPESERAHYVAQLTLCALAGLVVAALVWAGFHGAFTSGIRPAFAMGAAPSTTGAPPSPGLASLPSAPSPPSAAASQPAPVLTGPPVLPPGKEISNSQVRDMVEGARAVRKAGDMQS